MGFQLPHLPTTSDRTVPIRELEPRHSFEIRFELQQPPLIGLGSANLAYEYSVSGFSQNRPKAARNPT